MTCWSGKSFTPLLAVLAHSLVAAATRVDADPWTASVQAIVSPSYTRFGGAVWPAMHASRNFGSTIALRFDSGWLRYHSSSAFQDDRAEFVPLVPALELRYDPQSDHSRSAYFEFGPALYWYRRTLAYTPAPDFRQPANSTSTEILAGFEFGYGLRFGTRGGAMLDIGMRYDHSTAPRPNRFGRGVGLRLPSVSAGLTLGL